MSVKTSYTDLDNTTNQCISTNLSNYIASTFFPSFLAQPVENTINFIPGANEVLMNYFGETIFKNAEIRADYRAKVANLHQKYQTKLASGTEIDEAFALEMFNERNSIKAYEKANMGTTELLLVQARNFYQYGNSEGPSFDYYIKKGKSFAEIAESSGRTGGKDLGLESDMFKCLFDSINEKNTVSVETNQQHYLMQLENNVQEADLCTTYEENGIEICLWYNDLIEPVF